MKNMTLSVIKADIGSVGGHIMPTQEVMDEVERVFRDQAKCLDVFVSFTGDDIAILCSHLNGTDHKGTHQAAWEAFIAGTRVAKSQGLYGAGQDLLADACSGNVKGLGPAVCEMNFEERPNESFLFFAADKCAPGAYNYPFYSAFADPMHCAGLLLTAKLFQGFTFTIMDVNCTDHDRVIQLQTPEDIYRLAVLLRDEGRFVIESICSRATGNIAAVVSTTRLKHIAGKYVGKDDPVALIRVQSDFPATGEILSPFATCHFVAGAMRGSHNAPLTPVPHNTPVSFFDGPPIVCGRAFSMKGGKFTPFADVFARGDSTWDLVRAKAAQKFLDMRAQGFFGPAMLGMEELEYGGITEVLKALEPRWKDRT